MKRMLVLAVVCFSVVGIALWTVGCTTPPPQSPPDTANLPEMTLQELSMFNGKNESPVYVAVDGLVYDFSGLSKWKDGSHYGYQAGSDLTEIIKTKSPHGVSKLQGKPVVATLITP
jgi:predicted heme/steroid binding protein